MRGTDRQTGRMFSYLSPETMVPRDHPLRAIRRLVDAAVDRLSPAFNKLYSAVGRPSIPPEQLLLALLADPRVKPLLSDDHFSVDGTLVEAWASMKSFRPKDGSGEPPADGRNGERDFHGEKHCNETHASLIDPDARLYKKAAGQAGKLCHMGHVVIENGNGLVVAAEATLATGTTSAIDGRTTRHAGYKVGLRVRKRIEDVFGWMKMVGGQRKTRYRGTARMGWMFTLAAAAYNLIRMPKLLAAEA